MPGRPPVSQLIIYAIGQFGWSLASFGAANLLIYFYMPPAEGAAEVFPAFVFQGAILGVITLIGLINFGARIFDAITDPWIANLSDRMDRKMGKRKFFMAIGAIPLALSAFLLFFPLVGGIATLNTVWLIVMVVLFYLSLTVYMVPYTALISELGHAPEDRMRISTYISVAWAMGFLVGSLVYAGQSALENSMGKVQAFQTVVACFSLLSLVALLVPVFFLNEKKYAHQVAATSTSWAAVRQVFGQKNFRLFAASDFLYWLSLTFIQLGVSYVVTGIFEWEKGMATTFLGISFLASLVLYVPINMLVKRRGKKRILLWGFLVFGTVFMGTYFAGSWPEDVKNILFYVLALTSAFPLAAFGIIPNAIVADLVYDYERTHGETMPGMFYAARNFVMKMGMSFANLLFPSLLLLGRTAESPMGIKAFLLSAIVFCLLGYVVFRRYQEPLDTQHTTL